MLVTNKSRGVGDKDEAMTAYLKGSAMLRGTTKGRIPAPPPALETSVVGRRGDG